MKFESFDDFEDDIEDVKPFVYGYKSPVDSGYTKIRLTKRELKKLAPEWARSKRLVFANLDVYIKRANTSSGSDIVQVEITSNWIAKTIMVLGAPIFIFISGFSEYKDDLCRSFNEKKKGSFVTDTFYSTDVTGWPFDFYLLEEILATRHPRV